MTAAKVELAGEVAIDLPAGPSEGLVLADATADPSTVAADLITQAEHGVDSPALLVTPDEAFADAVEAEVRRRLATALRRDILARALGRPRPDRPRRRTSTPAIAFVNGYGPEHLSIDVADAEAAVARIRNAGSIFVGRWSPESRRRLRVGRQPRPADGRARARLRSAGGRDVRQVQPGPADHARGPGRRSGRRSATLAEAEGLLAHRDAVEARFDDPDRDRGPPMSPSPFSVSLAHRSRLVQLGGDRRGRRRALRHPDLAGPAVRPQHLARAARAPRGPARRGPVRDAAVRVPAGRLPPARRGGRRRATASRPTSSSRARAPTRSSTCARRRSCPRARRP